MANDKMVELELRDYPIGLLEKLIGTKGKQATDRKLEKYGYGFSSNGRGTKRIYTITSLPDAFHQFKSFCVFSLGLPNNLDYVKFRDFIYLFLSDEDFNWRPDEQKEEYTRLLGKGISRQTIADYTSHLKKLGFVNTNIGDFVYYKVNKNCGVQEQKIITREEYSSAWKMYWEWRNTHPDEDSEPAYKHMYNKFEGVPRKQRKPTFNGIYNNNINRLLELASNTILDKVSNQHNDANQRLF